MYLGDYMEGDCDSTSDDETNDDESNNARSFDKCMQSENNENEISGFSEFVMDMALMTITDSYVKSSVGDLM